MVQGKCSGCINNNAHVCFRGGGGGRAEYVAGSTEKKPRL